MKLLGLFFYEVTWTMLGYPHCACMHDAATTFPQLTICHSSQRRQAVLVFDHLTVIGCSVPRP